jgi:DNA polymerase (family 10)
MINQEFHQILETFGNILELRNQGSDKFKVRAYRQAALTVQNLPKDLTEYYDEEKKELTEKIPGFGPAIQAKAIELIETGEVEELDKLKKTIPAGLLDMLEIKNVGPKKVKKLWKELGIENMEQLEKAIIDGKVAELDGLGEKSAEKILEGIKNFEQYSKRTPLGVIYTQLQEILKSMKECKYVEQVEIAGSSRRMKETIGDVDVLATGKEEDHEKIIDYFMQLDYLDGPVEAKGETKVTTYLKGSGTQIDLRVVKPDEFGAALQYFTGSQAHNVKLRGLAKKMGLKINEYGVFKTSDDSKVAGATEEDVYATMGLTYIPPEIRQGNNEIDVSQKKKIPDLIELKDIKGELHCHSTYSDGKHSIEEMAKQAQEMGYEYIAITDHSPTLKIANGLESERLLEKKKEIDELNKKLDIRILFGTEVDILADGSLDYDDKILSEFDIVVASVHSRFEKDNTERILKAMQNPHVHIIGHPTGRLINKREAYSLDLKQIYQEAANTNTILEINSQPIRLDLKSNYVREAKENYGVKFSINTDAHNKEGLMLTNLGIGQARRGWLTKDDVINTQNLKSLLKNIK